jgi:hypothetical protein
MFRIRIGSGFYWVSGSGSELDIDWEPDPGSSKRKKKEILCLKSLYNVLYRDIRHIQWFLIKTIFQVQIYKKKFVIKNNGIDQEPDPEKICIQ